MAEEVTKVVENVDKLFSEIVVNGESHVSDRYVPPEPVEANPPVEQEGETPQEATPQEDVQGEYVDTLYLNNIRHDLKDSPLTQEVSAIQQAINTLQGRLNDLIASVGNINSKIPVQASAQNQLADKNFVNSSIATNTANFLGTYSTLAEIEAIPNPTNNDYAFLETADGEGNNVYDRYKYSAEDEEWLFEYELNNSSFTAEQWATINSGITEVTDVVQSGNDSPVSSDAVYNALQNAGGGSGGAVCETAGNVLAKEATMDNFVLTSGVAFPITFLNSNTVQDKITLSINGTTPHDVYINGEVSSATNYDISAGTYIAFYNNSNYYITTTVGIQSAYEAIVTERIRTSQPSNPVDGDIWIV